MRKFKIIGIFELEALKRITHLFTGAIIVHAALTGTSPIKAVSSVVADSTGTTKEIVSGSADSFWHRLTDGWHKVEAPKSAN